MYVLINYVINVKCVLIIEFIKYYIKYYITLFSYFTVIKNLKSGENFKILTGKLLREKNKSD